MQSFATFLNAAQNLTGSRKRDLMAKVAPDYLRGRSSPAELIYKVVFFSKLGLGGFSNEMASFTRC